MPTKLILTDHGKKRLMERLSLPKRAIERQLNNVWTQGKEIQNLFEDSYSKIVKRFKDRDYLFFLYPDRIVFCTVFCELQDNRKHFVSGQMRKQTKKYKLLGS